MRYKIVFHGSTLLALKRAPLVSSVTGGPVPAYISVGGSKAVTGPGSGQGRLQPAAAPLCGLSRTASFSKPFYQIKAQYSTSIWLCQEGKLLEQTGFFLGSAGAGRGMVPLCGTGMHPPFSFPAGKENGPCTVQKKSAFGGPTLSLWDKVGRTGVGG